MAHEGPKSVGEYNNDNVTKLATSAFVGLVNKYVIKSC